MSKSLHLSSAGLFTRELSREELDRIASHPLPSTSPALPLAQAHPELALLDAAITIRAETRRKRDRTQLPRRLTTEARQKTAREQ